MLRCLTLADLVWWMNRSMMLRLLVALMPVVLTTLPLRFPGCVVLVLSLTVRCLVTPLSVIIPWARRVRTLCLMDSPYWAGLPVSFIFCMSVISSI